MTMCKACGFSECLLEEFDADFFLGDEEEEDGDTILFTDDEEEEEYTFVHEASQMHH